MYLTSDPLELATLVGQVQSASRGAIACFLGTVRDHNGGRAVLQLDYSAYEPMAEAECARIQVEAERRWECAVALQHRTGTVRVGEAAVVVAAASAHRDEAFAACRFVIEEIKRRVPIWKREVFVDGTMEWVEGGSPGQMGSGLEGQQNSGTAGKLDGESSDLITGKSDATRA
ncbi:MAG TPA: molybdenum cofactor biosynthesis protein MoaE [Gemmatimonadales bacterium]|nr:molybdenum cofactor biosynthesis protein MoaE [Gemmatimonadales bacterium]